VLVNSSAVADRLEADRTVSPARITLIRNGVDVSRFRPGPVSGRHAGESVTVGTLANLRPEKGVADIVQAAAIVRERYHDVRFVLFGEGPLRPELERLIHRHGLTGCVELRGGTADPAAALRDLDIFVLASHSEASSNGLLEAMATRLAVIATNVGGNPGLVEDERTGLLVPPGDPAAMAKAIVRLVEDPALAIATADRAFDRIQTEFTIPRLLQDLQAFYERVLGGSRSRCA